MMRSLVTAITLILPTSAFADINPARWLDRCLNEPITATDYVERSVAIFDNNNFCMSTIFPMCNFADARSECLSDINSYLDQSFVELRDSFPDFSKLDNFTQKRYLRYLEDWSIDPQINDESVDCELSEIECVTLDKMMRLLLINDATRGVLRRLEELP